MTRQEKHALVLEMRGRGMTYREVAEALGMTRSGVCNILNDPDGSKQKTRRERYRGTCVDCGKRTDGSSGFKGGPTRCVSCNNTAIFKVWTREKIIAAIQAWAAEHGRPPRAHPDWTNAGPGHPAASTVQGTFGSWAEGIVAAGFPRPLRGLHIHGFKWEHENTVAALQAWAQEHGRAPLYVEWTTGEPGRPTTVTVVRLFGSWAYALRAAGLEPARGRKAVAA